MENEINSTFTISSIIDLISKSPPSSTPLPTTTTLTSFLITTYNNSNGTVLDCKLNPRSIPSNSITLAIFANYSRSWEYHRKTTCVKCLLRRVGCCPAQTFPSNYLYLPKWTSKLTSFFVIYYHKFLILSHKNPSLMILSGESIFQAANFFFAAAFLVPRSFKASIFALRVFLTAGFMLQALWAGVTICSLDTMLWCLSLGMLNGIHSLILACKFLPPALSPEFADLYLKFFKPYRVSKKYFQELAKEARIHCLDPGQTYATESITPGDERLSILLRGK